LRDSEGLILLAQLLQRRLGAHVAVCPGSLGEIECILGTSYEATSLAGNAAAPALLLGAAGIWILTSWWAAVTTPLFAASGIVG
jgi:hypothetical protein